MVLVKMLRRHQTERRGETIRLQPGDYFEFSDAAADVLIANGFAERVVEAPINTDVIADAVVVIPDAALWYDAPPRVRVEVGLVSDLPTFLADPSVERLVWWDGRHKLTPQHLVEGLALVRAWDAAAVIPDYDVLASDIGTEDERQHTEAVILDLRVPVFSTGLLFVRNSEGGRGLIERWVDENDIDGNSRLALLRAIWKCDPKPMINPLPSTWAK